MKLSLFKFCLLPTFVFLITLTMSCKKAEDPVKVVTMVIASKLDKGSHAPPASTTNPTVISYMNITEQGTNEKYGLALGRIEGFNYVEGYQYALKVQKTTISNPPADGYTEKYKLLEVISTTKVGN